MRDRTQNKSTQIKNKGKFIVFEGIDGSGKSTQIQYLIEKLKQQNVSYYITKEPTDSPIGSLIHQIMIGRVKTDNKVIAALFVADRLDHLLNDINGIVAKIEDGITIVSDRYYFSSYAYHSIDMPMDWVIQANEQCKNILKPTLTIFLDVNPDIAIERIAQNRFHQELFEKSSRLIKVREKYLESFTKLNDSENIIVVDGNRAPELIAEEIWKEVKQYFL